ncbi:O-antigen ligase family protein [Oscillatoria sp. CS-180]|uniref:O-antigen ligase family protein n=1 Tax=Oscillatoria sp. CS-180 TaxID=3021720 RepID=UPI002330D509|nr:O-antigen ligase family protein [Oscillatoria sp. CS-180]MDB9527466.1 O-antigen ligase family protein [Oscillatoria sp. CS-180]
MQTSQQFSKTLSAPPAPSPSYQALLDPGLIDRAIAVLGILHSTATLSSFFSGVGIPGVAETLIRYLLPVMIAFRLAARYKATVRVLQSDIFLLIFHAIVFVSFAWSINPQLTILGLRSEYIQGVLIALFLATRFSLAQQVRLITVAMGITALISLAFAIGVPSIGIHQDVTHAGAWKGIFGHKNYFSTGMTTCSAVCLVQVLDSKERKPWILALLGLCVALLFLSTSKTGQVLLIMVISFVFLYRRYRWRGMKTLLILYLGVVVATCSILFVYTAWDQIFIGIGRDPTLSGRTLIWDVLRQSFIPNKALLGYGRSAFWTSEAAIAVFVGSINFVPTHAHNGWYDLVLDVGFIGLFFYGLSSIQAWVRAFKLAYVSDSAASIWPIAFFTIMYVNNYTESLMTYLINFLWIIYMATCWSLREALMRETMHQEELDEEKETLLKGVDVHKNGHIKRA